MFASEHYLTDIFDMIKAERPEIDIENDLWAPITRLIINSLRAMRPCVHLHGEQWMKHPITDSINSRAYQLLGFDIIFDDDLNPHFLEINGETF